MATGSESSSCPERGSLSLPPSTWEESLWAFCPLRASRASLLPPPRQVGGGASSCPAAFGASPPAPPVRGARCPPAAGLAPPSCPEARRTRLGPPVSWGAIVLLHVRLCVGSGCFASAPPGRAPRAQRQRGGGEKGGGEAPGELGRPRRPGVGTAVPPRRGSAQAERGPRP
ncbi:unnamed protein product [Prorocentrum cordatum]|uniref:Uncharacterized protein n=1 Tax=Prorocentrum cordatum TaxID=2364126 RepID=A0ABN9QUT1_9DINO|nr:unnamed protein product [Polarella glacialis]